MLSESWTWRGRTVRWQRLGSGPAVVFCHGTPWSSLLWRPIAEALSSEYTVHLWDMPGYGLSSMEPEHRVSLDVQAELLADLLVYWNLESPHLVVHDYGGAVALRAHLLHDASYATLTLVDVVAMAPWGSDFFRLVHDHESVFAAVPSAIHEGMLRAYVEGASHNGLSPNDVDGLIAPWISNEGQAAFYRQIAQADQSYTDEIQPRYSEVQVPVLIIWGAEDMWIPVEQAYRLQAEIPAAELRTVARAGHLVQLDQPVATTALLVNWLNSNSPTMA